MEEMAEAHQPEGDLADLGVVLLENIALLEVEAVEVDIPVVRVDIGLVMVAADHHTIMELPINLVLF
jgi:hypothetical protein